MCLRNLKERLLERANIIQARLDKENALLAKRQAAFQRSQREHDQGTDDEFERFCSDTMFRIQILEQRLASHEETALQKYVEMDQRLHSDPRLKILHKSN
jgi:bacterioferritin (cytochrome b1)